jgi:hypothetical protein
MSDNEDITYWREISYMKKFIKLLVEAIELHGKAQPEYAAFIKNIKKQK